MLRNPYDIYGAVSASDMKLNEDVYCSLNYSDSTAPAPDYVPASLLSSMIGRSSPRQYIDPWDLENYAYLQRSRGSAETDTGTETDDCCESTASSQFYWATDKQDYYKRLTYDSALADSRNIYACDGSCNSPLCDQSVYGTREPQLLFPPPPYEFDPYDDPDSDAQTVLECQECSLSYEKTDSELYYQQQPLYSTANPQFSLNKKGLLQIDYSCNWNCLDMDFNFSKLRL